MAATTSLPLYGDRHFVRFLFPFSLKETLRPKHLGVWLGWPRHRDVLAYLSKRIERIGQWQPCEISNPEYILPHVARFLIPDTRVQAVERYVLAYQMSDQELQQRIPKGGKCQLVVQAGREERWYPVEFQEVHLYLFRSGVGILMLQVAMKQDIQKKICPAASGETASVETLPFDLEQLIQFNRAFRRIQRRGHSPYFRLPPRGGNPENQSSEEERRFVLSELLDELLTPIGREREAWEAFYERRLIGYAFALVSRQDDTGKPLPIPFEELKRPLFWLRRYVDPNYLPTGADLRLEDNPEVVQTFENIYFGLSLEGSAVLAWNSGRDFIRNQLHASVRDRYFLLFLLALHQRLATIHLARLVDQTSYLRYSHRPMRRKVVREIQQLRTRIFAFIVHCWFAEVSNMQMYTKVYRAWQRVFEVEPLLGEVKAEVEELDDYLQRVQMERESRIINEGTDFSVHYSSFGVCSLAFPREDVNKACSLRKAREILDYLLTPLSEKLAGDVEITRAKFLDTDHGLLPGVLTEKIAPSLPASLRTWYQLAKRSLQGVKEDDLIAEINAHKSQLESNVLPRQKDVIKSNRQSLIADDPGVPAKVSGFVRSMVNRPTIEGLGFAHHTVTVIREHLKGLRYRDEVVEAKGTCEAETERLLKVFASKMVKIQTLADQSWFQDLFDFDKKAELERLSDEALRCLREYAFNVLQHDILQSILDIYNTYDKALQDEAAKILSTRQLVQGAVDELTTLEAKASQIPVKSGPTYNILTQERLAALHRAVAEKHPTTRYVETISSALPISSWLDRFNAPKELAMAMVDQFLLRPVAETISDTDIMKELMVTEKFSDYITANLLPASAPFVTIDEGSLLAGGKQHIVETDVLGVAFKDNVDSHLADLIASGTIYSSTKNPYSITLLQTKTIITG